VLILAQIPVLTCVCYLLHQRRQYRLYRAGDGLLILLILLAPAVRALRRRAMASWPSAAGTAKFTRVREDRSSLWQRYRLAISYKYYIRDEPYWGLAFRRFLSEPEAEAEAGQWRDRAVTVHYHPRHPDRSVLA